MQWVTRNVFIDVGETAAVAGVQGRWCTNTQKFVCVLTRPNVNKPVSRVNRNIR